MKHKLIIAFVLFFIQIGLSQTGMFVHGKVVSNETPIKGVEVISLNTRNIALTDNNGLFSIIVKPKDVLIFGSKNHNPKRIYLSPDRSENYHIKVILTQKEVQLEEIVVTSLVIPKFDSKKITDLNYFDDNQSSPRNNFVYNGSIERGLNFVRIYRDLKEEITNE